MVCVVVVSGSLSDEVVVSLNTQDNTAIGRFSTPPVDITVCCWEITYMYMTSLDT